MHFNKARKAHSSGTTAFLMTLIRDFNVPHEDLNAAISEKIEERDEACSSLTIICQRIYPAPAIYTQNPAICTRQHTQECRFI